MKTPLDHQPPIFLDPLLDEPGRVREMVERTSPHLPVQRYFRNDAEYRASAAAGGGAAPVIIAPNFRADWAHGGVRVDGAELFLEHAGLRQAAGELFGQGDLDLVEPQMVFANLTWQLPFDQGGGHTDVPAFRGINRLDYPVWVLNMMGQSRLFEDERVRIATAVAWFYEGSDGGFEYWGDGPDAPSTVHEGDIYNTAIVGDNDRMFHRVRPVGPRDRGLLPGMDLETQLAFEGGDDWCVRQDGEVRARFGWPEVRTSVSYKAVVYRDREERRLVAEHAGDLTADAVFERFYADLDARGIDFERPRDPLASPELVELLARVYLREPTCYEKRRAS